MKRGASRGLCVLSACAALLACDAAAVPVFSAGSAGSAGAAGSAGSAGAADTAGMPGTAGVAGAGSVGFAGASSGGGGASGGDTGAGGASSGQGGDIAAGGGDTVCRSNADCPETFFCSTQTCARGAPGVCVVKPFVCPSDLTPVCGCDHLTYWNDCVGRQYGVSASSPGQCMAGARTCHGNNECPGPFGATCARLLTPGVGCGTSADQGTCWVTPSDCSMTDNTPQWQSCPPPASGDGLGPCTSTCAAVKSGYPFVQAGSTTCPAAP